MKMSDMRAKARAIFGPAIAEPMPKQPNGAKALQERANARPIPTYKNGGRVQTSADTAKKLATEMGGMKKGGKAKKDGLAVMIAIGEPMKGMKKPVKKMAGGKACAEGGEMMKPVKRAQGGAGKVRKGMMTPEGQITHAMNKVRNS